MIGLWAIALLIESILILGLFGSTAVFADDPIYHKKINLTTPFIVINFETLCESVSPK